MPPHSSRPPFSSFDHSNPNRLHRLLVMLQSGDPIHAGQAADLLGVSRRTVARDLKFLREDIGLNIDFDQGARSYQLLSDETETSDGTPDHGTLAAFIIARHALAALGGSTADRSLLEAATDRLVAALPPTLRIEEHAAADSVPATLSFSHIVLLHRAIEGRHVVSIHRNGKVREAETVVPRALLSRQGRWWAVAEGADDPAAFRFVPLDRTDNMEDLGVAPPPAPPLDLDGLIAAHPVICESPDHRAYRLRLTAAGAARCTAAVPPFQHRLVPTEHGADLYACAASAEVLAPWCLSLGVDFEAEDPDLRAAIVQIAEEIASRHGGA
jgi:predicted DNA-binding transcriptional regulator YafY